MSILNSDKQHAMLSPSGASRWLVCTPSALLEAKYPRTSNKAADEGTFAHSLSELILRKHNKEITESQFEEQYTLLCANQYYSIALEDHCIEFAQFVLDTKQAMQADLLILETTVDLSFYIPGGKGTTDVTVLSEDVLHIIDLKYGKGHFVDAVENKQMMLYALGVLKIYELSYSFKTVRMTIYQPRMNNYSSYDMKVEDLVNWGESYLRPRALMASLGEGEYVPGDNCKWCKAKGECRALAARNLELAKHDFREPNELTAKDIAAILEIEDDLTSWFKSVKEYALSLLKRNEEIPGYKMVEARTNRKISDIEALKERMAKFKIPEEKYMKPRPMMGLGDLEINLGRSLFKAVVEPLLEKNPGELTIVSEYDRRAPVVLSTKKITNALDAFSDVPE